MIATPATCLAATTDSHFHISFIAPAAMGYSLEGVPAADGFREGFLIVGAVTMIGGLLGLWLINPKADRERLARCAQSAA
jgi:hypothetical protein